MIYNDCPLFGLKSKKKLKLLLHINNNKIINQNFIASQIEPYIDTKNKPRLIESPGIELKKVQKRIKNMLGYIHVSENVFSGIKGRSYAENAFIHTGSKPRNLFKVDLKAFFPSISRDKVYRFFLEDLCCSFDVANILTNLTTVDLEKTKTVKLDEIYKFLNSKNVGCKNHLISGAPTSQILSYFVNYSMFYEMEKVANSNNIIMTVYVDDITFSSENAISNKFRKRILTIIKKYNYRISDNKVKKYTKLYPKLVTGVIIDSSGKPVIRNSMRLNIYKEFAHLLNEPSNLTCRSRLRGLLAAARQVDKFIYPTIYKFAYCKSDNE